VASQLAKDIRDYSKPPKAIVASVVRLGRWLVRLFSKLANIHSSIAAKNVEFFAVSGFKESMPLVANKA